MTVCTVTNIDTGVEFYDIKTQSGFEISLPGVGSQLQSGSQVAMDSKHHFCVVTQPVSTAQGTQQSAVWVFDERNGDLGTVTGFTY